MIVEFYSYTEQEYKNQRREHMHTTGDNYYGLEEIFNDSDFLSVLSSKDILSAERLASYFTGRNSA